MIDKHKTNCKVTIWHDVTYYGKRGVQVCYKHTCSRIATCHFVDGCRKWFFTSLVSLLGVQNVELVRLKPVFLSGHNASASNIRESQTVE